MRIAYYFGASDNANSGVFKKIVSQTRQWIEKGNDVGLFSISSVDTREDWTSHLHKNIHFEQVVYKRFRDQIHLIPYLTQKLLRWKPDIVYIRYMIYHFIYNYMIYKKPVVVEINTNDLEEAKKASFRYYQYLRFTRGLWLKYVAGMVFVSNEVKENPDFRYFQVPKTTIANGIDLSLYNTMPTPTNEHPRILFIGSPGMLWHGTDKIIRMAIEFPNWHFDLIGPSQSEFQTIPPNVVLHGILSKNAYMPLVAQADAAISSLGLHRINIHENSPLKMSEYLAWGLPVIAGYKDTNFMQGADFILELPATESNVLDNLSRIRDFVMAVKGTRVPRGAIQHIDSAVKESERLKFFQTVLQMCR
jgi:glycosyltransferase involved in cell wall biosynthesis